MINLWLWLFLFLTPLLVFAANPESGATFRIGTLLFAVLAGYAALNLSLHTHHITEQQAYEACQSRFADGHRAKECDNALIGNGAQRVFYVLFGWVLAAIYTGFWECIWRIKYQTRIKQKGKGFKGKRFGNLLIGLAIFSFIIYPASAAVSWLVLHAFYR